MARRDVRQHIRHLKDGRTTVVRRHTRNYADKENNGTNYEPSRLFNILAGGVMIILGISLIGSLISYGVGHISSTVKAVKTVKDTKETVEKVSKAKNSLFSKSKVTNNTDFSKEVVDEIIDTSKDKLLEQYGVKNIDTIYLVKYEDACTEELYKKNIINKLKEGKSSLFIISDNSVLNADEVLSEHDVINQIMTDTHGLDVARTFTVSIITSHGIPNYGNVVHIISYS